MIGSLWGLLLVGLALATGVMAVLWYVQVRIHDASHVDVAWAALIACAALLYALLADGGVAHRVLAAVLASLWGFRLAGYLYVDRIRGKSEDGRYRELRAKWGAHANSRFFWFFQFQALFVVFFSLPFALVCLDPDPAISGLAWTGVGVWAVGNGGTIVADRQLAVWRANPSNHGKTVRTGLWSWSRHPNYFGEISFWFALALFGVAASPDDAWWIFAGTAAMIAMFLGASIPMMEARSLERRPSYQDVIDRVPMLVPRPPRRRTPS